MSDLRSSIAPAASQHDGSAFGWRYSAVTRGGEHTDGDNDDAWIIRKAAGTIDLAVIDVATQKRGVSGTDIQIAIADAFASSTACASPAEVVASAHARVRALLRERVANGVACLLVVRLTADGVARWAHAGDAVLIRWRPSRWLRPRTTRVLNERHRRGQGLTHCVGTRSETGPMIEEGHFIASAGERLLLATDGIYHDAMALPSITGWIDAHHRHRHLLLTSDLVRKVEAEARSFQCATDDTGLIVAERLGLSDRTVR